MPVACDVNAELPAVLEAASERRPTDTPGLLYTQGSIIVVLIQARGGEHCKVVSPSVSRDPVSGMPLPIEEPAIEIDFSSYMIPLVARGQLLLLASRGDLPDLSWDE